MDFVGVEWTPLSKIENGTDLRTCSKRVYIRNGKTFREAWKEAKSWAESNFNVVEDKVECKLKLYERNVRRRTV